MVLGGVLVNPEIRKIIKARTIYPIWLCLIACILAFFCFDSIMGVTLSFSSKKTPTSNVGDELRLLPT